MELAHLIGSLIAVLGAVIAIGGGEIPLGMDEFQRELELVDQYRVAKFAGRAVTVDERTAYSRHVTRCSGAALIFCGILALLSAIVL